MVFILPETFAAEVVDVVVVDVVVVVVVVVVEAEVVVVVPIVLPDAASMCLTVHTTSLKITCVVGWSWPWGRKARKGKLKRCHKLFRRF